MCPFPVFTDDQAIALHSVVELVPAVGADVLATGWLSELEYVGASVEHKPHTSCDHVG